MNILPVKPQQIEEAVARTEYFDVMERYGYDIACVSCDGLSYDDLVGKYMDVYTSFAAEARRRGYPACIRIHATLSAGDRIAITEAQYDILDQPQTDEKGYFASFASESWREYLKDLIDLFVRDCGFQCVILDGCEYRVDIPGSLDRFYEEFTEAHPDVKYPSDRRENSEYLLVQQAKAKSILAYFKDVVAHAKQVGAKHVGIIPTIIMPSSKSSINPSCDIGALARIPGVDFLVSRMNCDDVANGDVRIADDLQFKRGVCYTEVLHHSSLTRTIAFDYSADKKADSENCAKDCELAALAAGTCGFSGRWFGEEPGNGDYGVGSDAAELASKLGSPTAPVAFVFSYSGTRHVTPYNYETVYQFYWALIKEMVFKAHIPILTFNAETLKQDLAEHPEVQVLVFDEHFPLTVPQMMVIRDWWESSQKRSAVTFGLGQGFSADVNAPGMQPSALAFSGMLELIGLKQEDELVVRFDEPRAIIDVSRVRRAAFLGEEPTDTVKAVAGVRRVFGSRANILYEIEHGDVKIPVVAEWRDRSTLAVFCGFGLSEETASMAVKAICYAIREVDAVKSVVDSCDDGIVWNVNKNDYIMLSNLSDSAGSAMVRTGRANFWDCKQKILLPDGDQQINVDPHSSRLLRVVGRRSKFLDVTGASCLRSLMDGAGRAEIEIMAGRTTTFLLRNSPKDIIVDGRPSTITQEVIDGVYYVTLQQCAQGERHITLKW